MRRSMRRTQRGTRRVFTITWVVLALMLGMLGLRYRNSHLAAHAPAKAGAPGQQAEPSRAPLPAKPANVRNG